MPWEAREVVKMEVYSVRGEDVALQNVWKITGATDTEHTVCIAKIVIIRTGSLYGIKHFNVEFPLKLDKFMLKKLRRRDIMIVE